MFITRKLQICLCSNNPNTHPFITDAEKNFLRKEMGQLDLKESPPTPWKAILTSRPVLALMVDMVRSANNFKRNTNLYILLHNNRC